MSTAPSGTPEHIPEHQSERRPQHDVESAEPADAHEPSEQTRTAILARPAVARVRAALTAFNVTTEIVVLGGAARTAAQAAAYLGVLTAQIANSLVFAATPQPPDPNTAPELLLMLASGAHRVDTAKVADLLELDTVEMASAAMVRDRTGFAIGGVAPVGHLQPVRTLIDVSLARYDTIWAAAGHPHAVFATSYDELLRITGGQPIEAT
jgi:prolyl-tRNA editing enzyme YbaK/EbsC (Cys-tRNA(Pro) deacylase)